MNQIPNLYLLETFSTSILPAIIDGLVKGMILLLLVGLVVACLGKSSAAARHCAWIAGLSGVLALPFLAMNLPEWNAIPNSWMSFVEIEAVEQEVPETGTASTTGPEIAVAQPGEEQSATTGKNAGSDMAVALTSTFAPNYTGLTSTMYPGPNGYSAVHWISLVWAAGALFFLGRLLISRLGIAVLAARAKRVTNPGLQKELHELCREFGIRRRVVLLLSHQRAIPMTWGVFLPRVLLPAEAAEWDKEKRRIALMHELAHVARQDCLAQVIGQIALAVHWFNPLVWVAVWRLAIEREHACDDLVLRKGINPPDYAELILNFSAAFSIPRFCGVSATTMAKQAGLEKRLREILNPTCNRRSPGRAVLIGGMACLGLILFPLAMLRAGDGKNPESTVRDPYQLTADSITIDGTKLEAMGNSIVVRSNEPIPSSQQLGQLIVLNDEPDRDDTMVSEPEGKQIYQIRMADRAGDVLYLTVDDPEGARTVSVRSRDTEGEKPFVKDESRSKNLAEMIAQVNKLREQLELSAEGQSVELEIELSEVLDHDSSIVLGGLMRSEEPQDGLDKLYREIADELERISNRLNQALADGKDDRPARVGLTIEGLESGMEKDLVLPDTTSFTGIKEEPAIDSAGDPVVKKVKSTEERYTVLGSKDGKTMTKVELPELGERPAIVAPSRHTALVTREEKKSRPTTETRLRGYVFTDDGAAGIAEAETNEPGVLVEIPKLGRLFSPGNKSDGQPVARPSEMYQLSLPVSGIVKEAPVKAGASVSKGQLLLQLDDRNAITEVNIAKKQVEVTDANIELKKVEFEAAESSVATARSVFKDGAMTPMEMDKFQREAAKARVALKVAEAEMAVALSQLNQAEVVVQQHKILAPIDGTLVNVLQKPGEFAKAGIPAVLLRKFPEKEGSESEFGFEGFEGDGGASGFESGSTARADTSGPGNGKLD